MARYRVTVIAHRSSPAGSAPWVGGSGILHTEVVRADDADFARDLVIVRVLADSARVVDSPVGIDTVTVDRVRFGRPAVRELVRSRRTVATARS